VTVHQKGDVWVVSPGVNSSSPEYPTDSASVAIALEKLSGMKKGELASKNPEKQSIFEVDTVKGMSVEVFNAAGKSLGTILIGKNTPDWNSNYVRQDKSNDVYTAAGGIGYSFFTDITRWRDKLIMSFDKSLAKNITLIRKDGTSIALAKADSGNTWNIITPEQCAAKSDQADGIISKLALFNAVGFQDTVLADSVFGLTKPELVVSIGLKNGAKKITFGAKRADGKNYAMVDGRETIYLVNDYDVNALNKELKDLKDIPPSAPAPLVNPGKKTGTKQKK